MTQPEFPSAERCSAAERNSSTVTRHSSIRRIAAASNACRLADVGSDRSALHAEGVRNQAGAEQPGFHQRQRQHARDDAIALGQHIIGAMPKRRLDDPAPAGEVEKRAVRMRRDKSVPPSLVAGKSLPAARVRTVTAAAGAACGAVASARGASAMTRSMVVAGSFHRGRRDPFESSENRAAIAATDPRYGRD